MEPPTPISFAETSVFAFFAFLWLLLLSGCPESHVLLGPDGGEAVPDEVILRPIGRVSEPGHNVAPKGSLLRAKNCTMRRPGALAELPEPITFGFGPSAAAGGYHQSPQFDNGSTPSQLVWYANPGTGQVGVESVIGGSPLTYEDVDGSSRQIEYFETPNSFRQYVTYPFWIARSNMYLADQRGVHKWASTNLGSGDGIERIWDVSCFVAGDVQDIQPESWLPDGEHVRYRAVVLFRENGLDRRSYPSVGSNVSNSTGNPRTTFVAVSVPVEDFYGSIQSVELYRSRNFADTVTIPNEYYLVRTFDVDDFSLSFDGSRMTVSYEDLVGPTDFDVGAALYTNGDEDSGNVVPPSAIYHASFRGHEFWGDVAEKEFFSELRRIDDSDVFYTMSGVTVTMGSDSVVVTDLGGAEVGMALNIGSVFPTGTYVVDISGAGPFTVTMSEDALINSSADILSSDTVFVRWGDGSTSRFGLSVLSQPIDPNNGQLFGFSLQSNADRIPWVASYIFASKHRCARMGSAQMWVSNPEKFDDNEDWSDLNTGTGSPTSGGTPALPALHRRRIYWSKHQEPEHTTLLSFQDVGGPGNIVGLGALRDALIILKEEGVYRLTGNNGNWRIDPLDTSVRILGGRSTQVMNNAVYTLSDRGLLRITSTGVENLTQNVINDWFRDGEKIGAVSRYMQSHEGYTPMGLFAAADESNREYVLHCEGGDASGLGFDDTEFLVFNAATGAFTTWELHEGSTLPVASIGYVRGWYESAAEQVPGVIYSRPFSTGTTNASMALIDNRQGSKPSAYWEQELAFRGIHIGDPTHIKQWIELVWDFDSVDEGAPVDVAALYATHEAEAIQTGFQTQTIGTVSKQELRLWPPRSAVARSTKPVFGLRGRGMRVFGLRASYRSSGRKSPL